jgi:hypothetical protein
VGAALLSFSNTNNMFVSSYYTICIVQMVSVMTSHGLQWDGPNPPPPPTYQTLSLVGKIKIVVKYKENMFQRSPKVSFHQFTS